MDPLREMEFFVLLWRQGSLSATARELDISAAAVSKRLASLENRLRTQLVNRSTRSMSLTADGAIYLEEAHTIVDRLQALENRLGAQSTAIRGLLRVNASLGFGRRYVTTMISDFLADHPDIEVQLHLSDHPLNLVESSYDIGIRFGPLPDSTLHARRIARHRRLICASPGYLARAGRPSVPADLTRHNCLVLRQNDDAYGVWRFLRDGQSQTVKVAGNLSCNDGESIVNWALDGHGVIMRAEWEIARHVAEGALEILLEGYALESADISAVYHYQQFVPARVRAFIDFFDRYVQQHAIGGGP